MRKTLAISVAKFARYGARITKRGGGSTLPGLLAEKIDPQIITKLSDKIEFGVIVITGTNGKTTTAKCWLRY
jgi:UDP-N-acetylmuramyl tripeptide synthase